MNVIRRTVTDNNLISEQKPDFRLQVAPDLVYAGATSSALEDDGQLEQHLFVDAESDGQITRLLWVQFAAFPEPTAEPETGLSWDEDTVEGDYEEDEWVEFGDLRFEHDSGLLNLDEDYVLRPSSRSAAAIRFLDGLGYRISGDAMFDRLTWLDKDLRSELTLMYSESLSPLALEAEDLEESGEAAFHWPALAEGLHERALKSFKILSD